MNKPNFLRELEKLTREEFSSLVKSGAFSGFSEQDMAAASEVDREKMRLMNESLSLIKKAQNIEWRRGQ